MKKIAIVTLTVVALLAAGISIAEKPKHHEHGHKKQCNGPCSKSKSSVLEENVQLTFKTTPKEKGDEDIVITVGGTPWFSHETEFETDEEEIYFAIEGKVAKVDEKTVLLNCSTITKYEAEEEESEVSFSSSVLLVPGREMILGSIYDQKLSVKIVFIDDVIEKQKKKAYEKKKAEKSKSDKKSDLEKKKKEKEKAKKKTEQEKKKK